ncbi:MAG: flagellar basal body rod protein FlgC [Deltaproteobacteria bacterium]|jgi:flagellar basal-body rod protein FlgC|nr:MAG: flagellar basal body rod protein FlgC [Deltaproteobacteria bacterium]UCH07626.1 MAG: flagellar basal body rod protein FlgC [Deltaproteobacteria bacterium]
MNFLRLFEISSSGLYAQRKRLDVIASNLANLETTRTENGGPYRRKMVVMSTKPVEGFDEVLSSRLEGVEIDDIVEDDAPFMKVYNPGHPDADEQGYVLKPNVDLIVEITNMLVAKRNFEANVTAVRSTKQMALKALEIGR